MASKKRKPTNDLSLGQRLNTKTDYMRQKEMVDRLLPVRSEIARFLDSKDLHNFAVVSKEVSKIPSSLSTQLYNDIQSRTTCAEITDNGRNCYGKSWNFKNQKSGLVKNCLTYCLFFGFISDLMLHRIYMTSKKEPKIYAVAVTVDMYKNNQQLPYKYLAYYLHFPFALPEARVDMQHRISEIYLNVENQKPTRLEVRVTLKSDKPITSNGTFTNDESQFFIPFEKFHSETSYQENQLMVSPYRSYFTYLRYTIPLSI